MLRELTAKAEQIMRDEPAITLVTNDWEPMTPTLMVDYYQPIARSVGLSRSDVGLSMLAATDGMPVGSFYEGVHAKPLYMKSVNSEGEKVEALDNIPVWSVLPSTAALNEESLKGLLMGTMSGEDLLAQSIGSIPLNQATKGISLKWEDPVVRRYNGQRAMRAQCNNALGYTAESARSLITEKVDTITLPEGYAKQWLGEHKASGGVHEIFVREYSVSSYSDDCYTDHVVQGFPQADYYFLLFTFGCNRDRAGYVDQW